MTTTAAIDIIALHEATYHMTPDADRVAELAASMAANGWVGAPVLTYTIDQAAYAVTGCHRIEAARIAGIEVETLDLADLDVDVDDIARQITEATGSAVEYYEAAMVGFALAASDRAAELGMEWADDVAWMVEAIA